MKNKKLFRWLLLLLLCLFMNYKVDLISAATIDNEPPKLISFDISDSDATPGEYFYFNVNAEDDISGIDRGSIGLYSPIKGYTVYQFDIDNLNFPKILIPEDAVGGEYLISHLMLMDKSENMITYYNRRIFNNIENLYDFGENTIRIVDESNFGDDKEPPVVSNVTANKQSIVLGEEVKVCAKITDDSKLTYVTCKLEIKDGFIEGDFINSDYRDMTYDDESGLYCATLKPTKSGEHFVSEIYVIDKYGNSKGYYSEQVASNYVNATLQIIDMPEIYVEGPENDIESPTLNSIKLNKQNVVAPGSIKIFVEASDNSTDFFSVQARFISEEQHNKNKIGNYSDGEIIVDMLYDDLLDKYVGTIELNQYVVSGNYYLQYIQMCDKSNNSSQYVTSYYPEGMSSYSGVLRKKEKIDYVSFEIKEEFKYDAVTSTINNNMLEIIKNQKDDAIIMIDSTNNYIVPESVFEAIKDTNKTIYIESNGYQWVFNGKDITNIKSINTKVYSELLVDPNINNDSQEYISIVFADNGMLPGKAKIRVKTDYTFRFIEGYNDLKLYFYNPSEEKYKELENKINLTDDGFYEFEIVHNSKYVLSNKEIKQELLTENEKVNEEQTNNQVNEFIMSNYLYIIIPVALIVIFLIIIIIVKKQKNKTMI